MLCQCWLPQDEDVSILINSMFRDAGMEDKPSISQDDFTRLLQQFNMDLITVGLDFKGARQTFLDTNNNAGRASSFALDAITQEKVPASSWLTNR